jgi:Tol biopolymer transport system component
VEWSTNPDKIWFLGHEPDGVAGIWSLSIKSGRPTHLVRFDTAPGKSNGPSLTSDGTRIFFTIDERFSNVRWAELVKR